ncbi:hypothetical protein B0H63DRAFT_453537 [Podospora didyma]|uniref:Uncharacterized protein n=1 Tax=Podospora didyma TaxID=330526 RepID=A0AAE0K9Z0_9PEZI|nr:hypothetical protein B0H63DRAFT_453537 [Podospora didyma]
MADHILSIPMGSGGAPLPLSSSPTSSSSSAAAAGLTSLCARRCHVCCSSNICGENAVDSSEHQRSADISAMTQRDDDEAAHSSRRQGDRDSDADTISALRGQLQAAQRQLADSNGRAEMYMGIAQNTGQELRRVIMSKNQLHQQLEIERTQGLKRYVSVADRYRELSSTLDERISRAEQAEAKMAELQAANYTLWLQNKQARAQAVQLHSASSNLWRLHKQTESQVVQLRTVNCNLWLRNEQAQAQLVDLHTTSSNLWLGNEQAQADVIEAQTAIRSLKLQINAEKQAPSGYLARKDKQLEHLRDALHCECKRRDQLSAMNERLEVALRTMRDKFHQALDEIHDLDDTDESEDDDGLYSDDSDEVESWEPDLDPDKEDGSSSSDDLDDPDDDGCNIFGNDETAPAASGRSIPGSMPSDIACPI